MTPSLIKLESFGLSGSTPPQPVYDQHALDQAYADGLAEGRALESHRQIATLSDELRSMAIALSDDEARRRRLRQEAVRTLGPVLTQIVAALAPAGPPQRLQDALMAELSRLAAQSAPLVCQIRCGARHRATVGRCLEDLGLRDVRILDHPRDEIEVTVEGGRIVLDSARVAAEITALIAEITEETPEWTQ